MTLSTSLSHLFCTNQREEHVEGNLNSIDEDKTVLRGNEFEVDGVNNWPHLPRSLARREKIILNLGTNGSRGVTINQSKICEEDCHENRAPEDLVDSNLEGNVSSTSPLDLSIKPVVEKVSRGSMVEETECRECDESFHVEWSSRDEDLANVKRIFDTLGQDS